MNNEYRRGTVLGLTIAEIFILLIFLVLLAFLGLANNWEEKEKEYHAGQQLLSEWRDVIEEFQAPEEIRTLHSKAKRLEQQLDSREAADTERRLAALSQKNVELREEIEAILREREELHDENTKLSQENSALQEERNSLREDSAAARRDADREAAALREEIETIREQRDESRSDNTKLSNMYAELHEERNTLHQQAEDAKEEIEAILREREELHDENTKLSQENSALQEERNSLREDSAAARRDADREAAALREEIETIREQRDESRSDNTKLSNMYTELREERDALHEQAADAKQEADRIRAEFDTFRRKGQNPPCWYETVPAGDGTREKAHYLFDIAVHDEYMVVRRRPIPPGRADDDHGRPYAEEAGDLGLEDIPFGERLTDEEMNRHMKPIRDLGKDRKVRSYSCIFWVKVWDRTSRDAKLRWKQAHDEILEGLFGTYVVKDDPWPDSN